MDLDVFITSRILGNGNSGRNREYPRNLHQDLIGYKDGKIHIICKDLCLYEHGRALSESVTVSYQDNEWSQTLDYEHIPFRCRKCHIHGHLF
jgi:hypothetical protein